MDEGRWGNLNNSSANSMVFGDMTGDGRNNFVASYTSGIWYLEKNEWVRLDAASAISLTFAAILPAP